jgi:hypothetical protein
MAKFTNANGIALVDFTSFQMTGGTYRWRFLNATNNLESSGVGEVKDTSRKILSFLSYQSQSDTNFYVRAGRIWIPWSFGDTNSAWLYYTKERTKIEILSNATFNTDELSNNPAHATGKPAPDR